MSELPSFVHDTRHILFVNAAGCALFRCTPEALVDLDMMELLIDDDFRGLARLRMSQLRDNREVKPMRYRYRRCDGSAFWATVNSGSLLDGTFRTTLIYEGEA